LNRTLYFKIFPAARKNNVRVAIEYAINIPKGLPMKKILIVEDSRVFLNLIKKAIIGKFDFECVTADSFEEARKLVTAQSDQFLMAVLDLNLPDAPNGEIVEYVISNNIPSIVLTALIDDNIRDQMMAFEVLDYIIKEGPQSLEQLTDTIRRFVRNSQILILVVDDSGVARALTRRMLEKQNFNVIEAVDGNDALEKLKANPQVQLVITDYHMPNMDGFELTAEIRKKIPIRQMAVIGMSAVGNPILSAKFLKSGANDFVCKPYYEEEFLWRINQNVEMLENIMKLKEAAIRDHLTGLYNRRYFFNAAGSLYENAKRKNLHIAIGMIDIDKFKTINDTYGHAAGDQVLRHLSETLTTNFRSSDIVARYGGEEFIVLTTNMALERYQHHFEMLRKKIETTPLLTKAGEIYPTISIGVTTHLGNSLEEMIKESDNLLYKAKAAGRNRVEVG
jgi:diguanylate cyclase (GGDEF)-like protein